VAERAKSHCEYCRWPESAAYFAHEIDHIYAEKHGGDTVQTNLCLACYDCNRRKGSDLCSLDHETGSIVTLYHPRLQAWSEHFAILENGNIEGLTPHGRVTSRLLQMNTAEQCLDRRRLLRLGLY
jgi:hypothetical protein